MKTIRIARLLPAIVLLLGLASPALAQRSYEDSRIVNDKWLVSLGGYLTEFETDASAGVGGFAGTSIDFEKLLGLDEDVSAPRLEAIWRYRPKGMVELTAFSLRRTGNRVIDEEIEWNGVLYEIGADIDTKFTTSVLKLAYRHGFVNNGRAEAGFVAGLTTYKMAIGLKGEGQIIENGVPTVATFDRSEQEVLAPVPSAGMFMNYAILPNLIMRVRADFFDLDVSDYSGRIVDTSVFFNYFVTRHIGLGLGSNTTDIDVRNDGENPWRVEYKQSGFVGNLTLVW